MERGVEGVLALWTPEAVLRDSEQGLDAADLIGDHFAAFPAFLADLSIAVAAISTAVSIAAPFCAAD